MTSPLLRTESVECADASKNSKADCATPVLRVEHCSFAVKSRTLLSELTFDIQPATLNCIVGPNGAGKSTLAKIISGEWTPSCGQVSFFGKPLTDYSVRELASKRSVVSQFHDTQFGFKCNEVIAMSFDALVGIDAVHAQKHADLAIEMMNIESLITRRFDQLSGGEQQRVMLARALTQLGIATPSLDKKLLVLDEPSSNMDIHHQQNLFALLKQLRAKGLTIIAVVHDLNQVYRHADRVLVLKEGSIVDQGKPASALNPDGIRNYFDVNASIVSTTCDEEHLLIHD